MPKQVPVYLFTGFLESGKTKFAQETLQDSSFNNGDRMLLLVCEEGIEEYNPDEFASPNIFMEVIESERDLTTEHLAALLKKGSSVPGRAFLARNRSARRPRFAQECK